MSIKPLKIYHKYKSLFFNKYIDNKTALNFESGIIPFTQNEIDYKYSEIDELFLSSLKINFKDTTKILESGYIPPSKIKKIISNELLVQFAVNFLSKEIEQINFKNTLFYSDNQYKKFSSESFADMLDFVLSNKIYSTEFFNIIFNFQFEKILKKGKTTEESDNSLRYSFLSFEDKSSYFLLEYSETNNYLNTLIYKDDSISLKKYISPIFYKTENLEQFSSSDIHDNNLLNFLGLKNLSFQSNLNIMNFINDINAFENFIGYEIKNYNPNINDHKDFSVFFGLNSYAFKSNLSILKIIDTAIKENLFSAYALFELLLQNKTTTPLAINLIINYEQDIYPKLTINHISKIILYLKEKTSVNKYYSYSHITPLETLIFNFQELQKKIHETITDDSLKKMQSNNFQEALSFFDYIKIAKISKVPQSNIDQLTGISNKISILNSTFIDNENQYFVDNVKNKLTQIVLDYSFLKELDTPVNLLEFTESISNIDLTLTNIHNKVLQEQLSTLKKENKTIKIKLK